MYKNMIILLLGLAFIIGCSEDPEPSLYDPAAHAAANKDVPVINSISGSDYAGVGELVISGANFCQVEPVNVTNQVSFRNPATSENVLATVLQVTENEMIAATPVIVGDSLQVKIWSSGSDPYSDIYYYSLKPAVREFAVADDKQGEVSYHSVAVSPEGKILVAVERKSELLPLGWIKVFNPDGEADTTFGITAQISPGIKYGPGNKAFFILAAGRAKQIKTLDLNDGNEQPFRALGSVVPVDFDFDPDHNVWLVARQTATDLYPCDIIKIAADGSTLETMTTIDAYLRTVRVYMDGGNVYVYYAGHNPDTGMEKIWRSMIKSDGTLENPEEVLDVAGSSWIEGNVQSVTFSAEGTMYIGSSSDPDAMYRFYPQSGLGEVLYPGLLEPDMVYLSWDNGNFIYGVQQIVGKIPRLLKIDVGEPGAPYYGRQ